MGIFSINPRISFPVNMSPKVVGFSGEPYYENFEIFCEKSEIFSEICEKFCEKSETICMG